MTPAADAPHVPVLLAPLMAQLGPLTGVWLDGTFGAGGYTHALLAAGATRVIAIDRDPSALALAAPLKAEFGDRLRLVEGNFADLDRLAGEPLDGVVLDLGVSSMQLDQPQRGFSFLRDGPLDMRMADHGPSAADLVNTAPEALLADIFHYYGEERAARRIARTIVGARATAPIVTTTQLVALIERCLPRPKPGQSHPATRSFQALRIAVNDEMGALVDGLQAAERALRPGGVLAVVTFHSLEDRIAKRFMLLRSGQGPGGSRHAPEAQPEPARFAPIVRQSIGPDDAELAINPRARSARLRIARRLDAPAGPIDPDALGAPRIGATTRGHGRRG